MRLPFWIKSSTLASRDVTEEVWEQRPSSSCQNGYRSRGRTCVAGEDEEMGQMDGRGEVRVTDSMRKQHTARSLKLTVDRTTALGIDCDLCL